MNLHIFREYDIRGLVGIDLNEETVSFLAKAIGTYFVNHGAKNVSLGYDARESSPVFCRIFCEILNQTGLNVINFGMIPTPLLYYTLFTEKVEAGVMITGSHNPAEFNGFKLCLHKDALHGEEIRQIKEIVLSQSFATGSGTLTEKDITNNYLKFVKENIKLGDRKLKVVVDAGNGIGGTTGAPLYKDLGFEVIELFIEPDSRFPNHHPDPTVEKNLQDAIKAVKEHNADLAIAFDGDGDRIGAIDEKGNIIWGDDLTNIFARSILEKQKGGTIIAEVKCSQRLFDDIEKCGGKAVMCKAGHSIIKAKMKETNAVLAGEMSGHIFFADRFFGFDDAIYSGARLLEILSHSEKPLSEFLSDLPKVVNTPEIRFECEENEKFEIVKRLTKEFKKTNEVIEIDGARILFENGWGLVRPSNTQALLVLRFEATDEKHLQKIRDIIETKLQIIINNLKSEI